MPHPMSDKIEFLKLLYRGFNSRDIESVLRALHEDVAWANGMEGGYIRGRDGGFEPRGFCNASPSFFAAAWLTRPLGQPRRLVLASANELPERWRSVHLIGAAINAKGDLSAGAARIRGGRESEHELRRTQRDLFHHAVRRMIHLRDIGDNDVC
jgi:hypothetical protein